ncbi:MAG: hypothetical protein QW806_09145 [Nitrososphaerota archaeon]
MISNMNFDYFFPTDIIENGKVNWQISTLSDYMFCPYLFYLKRMEKKDKQNVTNSYRYNSKHVEIGTFVHNLVDFIIRNNLYGISITTIKEMFVDYFISSNLDNRLIDIKQTLISAATDIVLKLLEEYEVKQLQPVIIVDENNKNYSLKLVPDIVTDKGIIEIKTRSTTTPLQTLPYKNKVQVSLFTEYLGIETKVLLCDINENSYNISFVDIDPISQIRKKVEYSTIGILNQNYEPINNLFSDRCLRCYYRNSCDKKSV